MSKFKRFLSSFLVLTMVLGMFSMLGGVFAVEASAADDFSPYTTHIKTYAELQEKYPDGFIYAGVEFLEADGTVTDHVVKPGDTLTMKYYLKTSYMLTNAAIDILFDRHVFDISKGDITENVTNKGDDVIAEGELYPTGKAGSLGSHITSLLLNEVSTVKPRCYGYSTKDKEEFEEKDYSNPKVSVAAKYATSGTIYLKWTKTAGYSSVVFTDDEDINFAKQIDYINTKIQYGSDKQPFMFETDDAAYEITITVRTQNEDGTIGKVFLPDNAICLNNSKAQVKCSVTDVVTDFTGVSFEKASSIWADNSVFDVEELQHTFYISADGTFGGGDTPTPTHTANFVSEGSAYGEPQTVAEGASITAPATDPTKSGSNFLGWSTDGTKANIVTFPQTMGTADVTYYAVFEEIVVAKHTATFMVDGETYGPVSSYEEGATIVAPADPSKTGYTFKGWSPAVGTMGTSDMVFKAQFEAKSYNVRFMDGSVEYTHNTVLFDSAYTIPPVPPTKEGSTFKGWVDADGNAPAAKHTVDSDVTFYAKWETDKYTVTFCSGNTTLNPVYSAEHDYGTDVSTLVPKTNPTQANCEFVGWATTPNATEANAVFGTLTADVTYYPVFRAIGVSIEYVSNGEVVYTATNHILGDYVASSDYTLEDTDYYYFRGWYSDEGCTVEAFPLSISEITTRVYAKWEARKFNVQFYAADKEEYLGGGNYEYGSTLTPPDAPEIDGKEFIGWFDADDNAAPATVTGRAVYYATYRDIQYTATFMTDDGEFDTTNGILNSTIVAPAKGEPTKVGHSFKGWAKQGTTTVVDLSTQKMPKGGVTYVAIFEANEYTIKYYVSGELKHTDKYKYGAAVTPWTYTPAEGETFTSWDVSTIPATMPAEDLEFYGTTGKSSYNVIFTINGEHYTTVPYNYNATVVAPEYTVPEGYTFSGWQVGFAVTGNVTLDATLEKNSYKLRYYIKEGDTETYKEFDVLYGDALTVPDAPTVPGATFLGWDKDVASMTMPASDVNVYADLSWIDYTVIFEDADGGEAKKLTEKNYGYVINASDVPVVSKVGSNFSYWTVNGTQVSFPYTVTGDVTFVPVFGANTYTITYYVDGDVYGTAASYEFGAAISLAEALTKTGHAFSGWTAKNATTGEAIDFPATMPAYNINVYGTFSVNKYTATFNAGDGQFKDGTKTKTVDVEFGSTPVPPETPSRSGYGFTGWTPALAPMGVDGATYTATYEAGAVGYTVRTYTMDTTGEYGQGVDTSKSGTADKLVTETVVAPAGFSVDTDKSVLSGTVKADGSLVLEVYYSRNKYALTIDGNAVEYYYEQAVPAVSEPTKTGYSFAGWSADIPATMPAKAVTITSKWNVNQYTITFNTDGGSNVPALKQDYGTAIIKPSAPTKTGYSFVKWDKEIPDTMPAYDMTITAEWNVNKYTITFKLDNGQDDVVLEQDYGTAVTAPADFTKEGHTFTTWNKTVPGTMPAEHLVITAKWKANSYNANFVVDGATTTLSTVYGVQPDASKIAVAKTGHKFIGWKNGDNTYATSDLPVMGAADVTYTAVYEANVYDAIFDAGEGKFKSGTTVTVPTKFGEAIVAPTEEPERYGFFFKGWTPTVGTMNAEGITFTAIWEQDTSKCSVQSVVRTSPDKYYEKGVAYYDVTVKGSPVKIEVAYQGVDYTSSWIYDRNDPKADPTVDVEETGIYEIKAYNAAGEEVAIRSADADYEVWTLRTIYVEGTYKVRAKLTFDESSWDSAESAYEFINKYDIEPADPADLTSATLSATTVTRGEYVNLTVVTSTNVNYIRVAREEADGSLTTVNYSATVATDNCTVTESNGVRTWNIRIRFTYTGNDDSKTETWKLQYHRFDKSRWFDTEYSYEIKMTKYKEVVSPVEGVDPYSVISVTAPESAPKGKYTEVTVVTTNDVARVRLTIGAKTATYLKTSGNVVSCTANDDGTLTWVIKYKFNTAGDVTVSAQARGNVWSTAVEAANATTVA